MTDRSPTPPDGMSGALATSLRDLDDESLRAAIHYGQALLDDRTEPTTEIDDRPGEEILSIDDHDSYTTVITQHDCEVGCENCPHGPYLYHVSQEDHIDGETVLNWTYLGHAYDA